MTDLDIYNTQGRLDAIKRVDADGRETWSSRDLMGPLGYGSDWRNFSEVVERAKAACRNSGFDPADHFAASNKMVPIGSGAHREVEDVDVSRYGAYLVCMNGNPRKTEIANAQTYFAAKTREAELASAQAPRTSIALPTKRELALMVIEAEDRAEVAEAIAAERSAQLAVVAPKAEAWDVLASADGDWAVADAAKVLSRDPKIKLGRGRLFTYLAEIGWIHRQRGDQRWRVYQAQVDLERMSEIPASHYHPRTGELVIDPPQVRITTKGLQELHRRLGGSQLAISA